MIRTAEDNKRIADAAVAYVLARQGDPANARLHVARYDAVERAVEASLPPAPRDLTPAERAIAQAAIAARRLPDTA